MTSRTRVLSRVALATPALALAVTGVIARHRIDQLRHDTPSVNRAVVDAAATSRVGVQVSAGLEAVLSYDYAHPAQAQQAAHRWLTGDAPRQYQVLFDQLQKLAAGQKLTLIARVVSVGVTQLQGHHAQLLVFVDQQSTRAGDGRSSVSAAQVRVAAVENGGHWRISELQPL